MQTGTWSIETSGSIMKSRLIDVEEAKPSIMAAAGGWIGKLLTIADEGVTRKLTIVDKWGWGLDFFENGRVLEN